MNVLRTVITLVAFTLSAHAGLAADAKPSATEQSVIDFFGDRKPTVLRLWPEGSDRNKSRNGKAETAELKKGNLRVTNTENPSLLIYPPAPGAPSTGASVVFCPGGGYGILAMANPKEFTEWANHLGITVATLKYHVPRSKADPTHQWPLADAQRAMRVLRSHAKRFQLAPEKVGIVGSSAGGHLAYNLCINHETAAYDPIDAIDELNSRPAFGMLFYPAYLTEPRISMSTTKALTPNKINNKTTPPIYVTVNGDDSFVHGNLRALVDLKDKKVPAELHVWSNGGHGGVFNKYPLSEFARPAARFLVRHDIIQDSLLTKSDSWLDETNKKLLSNSKANQHPVIPAATPPAGLAENQLSPIDRDVRKRCGSPQPVYNLWPGDGTRADDPFKNKQESVTARNVPVASNVTAPTMTFFAADKPNGRTVLVFPGGGYGVLAYVHEGLEIVQWLNSQGINAFLVKYRTPRRAGLDKHHVALQDAHRAIRLVRSQSTAFGIHPDAIGVLGFSAGGHLATLSTTKLENDSYPAIDKHDTVSPIADFGILIYPAYTTTEGDTVDPWLLQKGKQPSKPIFVATALDDKWTRGQFFLLHERLKSKQAVEYHVYENGGHGKGMRPNGQAFAQWPRECARWLKDLNP